jgi:hypothetical protein
MHTHEKLFRVAPFNTDEARRLLFGMISSPLAFVSKDFSRFPTIFRAPSSGVSGRAGERIASIATAFPMDCRRPGVCPPDPTGKCFAPYFRSTSRDAQMLHQIGDRKCDDSLPATHDQPPNIPLIFLRTQALTRACWAVAITKRANPQDIMRYLARFAPRCSVTCAVLQICNAESEYIHRSNKHEKPSPGG